MGITDDELIGTFHVRKRFGWSIPPRSEEGGSQSRQRYGERPWIRAERHRSRAETPASRPRSATPWPQWRPSSCAMRRASRGQLLAASPEVLRLRYEGDTAFVSRSQHGRTPTNPVPPAAWSTASVTAAGQLPLPVRSDFMSSLSGRRQSRIA